MKILKAEGNSVDGNDDHWFVLCPGCEKEFEYTGYFDSGDVTVCSCGCSFITTRVWIDEKTYME
jgi:hypothetical protein